MKVIDFITEFNEKHIMNTKINPTQVEDYIKEKLEIIEYLPFLEKRRIVEMVVARNTVIENGSVKIDSIGQFMSFIVSMLMAHSNLEIGENPVDDYDSLCRAGLLESIIATFQKDYSECETLLKMAVADKLSENSIGFVVGRFLNGVSDRLDVVLNIVKNATEDLDLNKILGGNFKEEDLVALRDFLDKNK